VGIGDRQSEARPALVSNALGAAEALERPSAQLGANRAPSSLTSSSSPAR
jgi:hypothetical protein